MATKKKFDLKDYKIIEIYSEDTPESRKRLEEGLEILAEWIADASLEEISESSKNIKSDKQLRLPI